MSYVELDLRDQLDAIQAEISGTTDKYTALGACVFAGGFSWGMHEAGFNVCGHLELPDLDLGSTVSKQMWPVAVAPLNDGYEHGSAADKALDLTWKAFIGRLKKDNHIPDVFYANPPCAAYAGTGNHGGAADDNIMCYTRYCAYEAAMVLQPPIWMWELVPQVFTQERSYLDAMAFRAKLMGYRCYGFLTTSAIHGGYQDRRRFHFIASKYDLDFDGVYAREPYERKTTRTLGEALETVSMAEAEFGPLPNNQNTYRGAFKDIFPFCPPGSHLRDVAESIMYEHYKPRGVRWSGQGKPGFGHTRGRMDRPSPNILGGHTVIHPTEDRYLTAREAAMVMGFPLDYAFSKGSKAYAEVGKGLCTHNAAFLGRVVHDALDRRVRTLPTLSNEKGHEGSWMQAIDWRNIGTKNTIKMSVDDQVEWWKERHPTIPVPGDL